MRHRYGEGTLKTQMLFVGVGCIAVASFGAGCAPTGTTGPQAAKAAGGEAALCAGVAEAARDRGPFGLGARVVRVEALHQVVSPKAPAPLAGAALYLDATPGLTEQWIDRVIECNLAHRATAGTQDTANPLAVENATIRVSPTMAGFRIAVTSTDPAVAADVLRRGQSLVM
jgi:hypothetical protein